ncbi:hypothetical protein HZB00_02975 [Candidatus Woesearchaeota archaeon]|nr:hypothetical protein [Candidatus Woesearchaeota archaeon]
MIIHSVSFSRGIPFFSHPKLVVDANDGKGSCYLHSVSSELISLLNTRLHHFSVATTEDFAKLQALLHDVPSDVHHAVELAVFNAFPENWNFFSPAKNLPRPVSFVYRKATSIRSFFVLSTDSADFSKSVLANELVCHNMEKKNLAADVSDAVALETLQDAIREVQFHFPFTLRIGADFSGASFSIEQLYELVQKYHLLYIQDPFPTANTKDYQELFQLLGGDCFIVSSSQELSGTLFNSVLLPAQPISAFSKQVATLKEQELNILVPGQPGIAALLVALEVPLLLIDPKAKETKYLVREFEKLHALILEQK